MELVALIGSDKESWGQVSGLINHGTWDKIFIIKTKDAGEYATPDNAEEIYINSGKNLVELKEDIINKLKGKFNDFEVCTSIASGNGKEHMALISALLSIPVGIRLVAFTKNGVEFIN